MPIIAIRRVCNCIKCLLRDLSEHVDYNSGCFAAQAELDIELHRNKFYGAKKRVVSDLLVGHAARVTTLMMEARHEAVSLQNVQTLLQALSDQVAGIKDAAKFRYTCFSQAEEQSIAVSHPLLRKLEAAVFCVTEA